MMQLWMLLQGNILSLFNILDSSYVTCCSCVHLILAMLSNYIPSNYITSDCRTFTVWYTPTSQKALKWLAGTPLFYSLDPPLV